MSTKNVIMVLIISFSLALMVPEVHADFPVTTATLGGNATNGSDGTPGNGGSGGAGGTPSGSPSVSNGTTGGNGGRGGNGGAGGVGGTGTWIIVGTVTNPAEFTVFLGGVAGSPGSSGASGLAGGAGGAGGYALWPGFMSGADGIDPSGGSGGGLGSGVTGVSGGDATGPGCGGGGGSSGPSGFVQYMSNGGNGSASGNGTGTSGTDGNNGSAGHSETVGTSGELVLAQALQLGGRGGNGGNGPGGGGGGGGGGGAGGGGDYPAGSGAVGGASGPGGQGGAQGAAGYGNLDIQDGGTFINEGTVRFREGASSLDLDSESSFINSSVVHMDFYYADLQGTFSNNGTITRTRSSSVYFSGHVSGSGVFEGNLDFSGVVSPGGNLGADIGTMTLTSDCFITGSLNIQLGGNSPGMYDVLELGESVSIPGAILVLEFANGFSESSLNDGDYFDIVQYQSPGSVIAEFAGIETYPQPLLQGHWELIYNDFDQSAPLEQRTRLVYHYGASGVEESDLPGTITLNNNYPNPFNPQTTVSYYLPQAGRAWFRIFDLTGNQVWEHQDAGVVPSGWHQITWTGKDRWGRDLASGTYLLKMEADGFQETKRMMLVR